ncbi:uncharacterized protein METZ01_LOCUS473962 [marine metagenome]|uniref:Uncharacterized protein n=1 Tax=marine metagenome TaxID=408172 RepID=A0A383BP01_9ZZZZ
MAFFEFFSTPTRAPLIPTNLTTT